MNMYYNAEFEKIKTGPLKDYDEIKTLFDIIQKFYDKINIKLENVP